MLRVLFVLLAVLAAMPLEVDVSVFLNATPSYAAVVRVYGKRIRLGGLICLDPKSFLKKRDLSEPMSFCRMAVIIEPSLSIMLPHLSLIVLV